MRTYLKSLLFFVALILTNDYACQAVSCFIEEDNTVSSCTITSYSKPSLEFTFDSNELSLYHSLHSSWTIDAELNGKTVAETNVFNSLRGRSKEVAVSAFLKEIILQLSNREDILALDKDKLYGTDKIFSYTSSSCDYYVFALRHILI